MNRNLMLLIETLSDHENIGYAIMPKSIAQPTPKRKLPPLKFYQPQPQSHDGPGFDLFDAFIVLLSVVLTGGGVFLVALFRAL